MARWSIGHLGFDGMLLRRDSRYSGFPKSVIDADLTRGDLRPFVCPMEVCDVGGVDTVIETILDPDICDCLTFPECVSYAKYCDLYFWNDETGAPTISTQEEFCLGQGCDYATDCPTNPPNISSFNAGSSSSPTASCDTHAFSYRYSYITDIGGLEMESHWSPPTNLITVNGTSPGVVLDGIPNPGGCHTGVKIYRAASGFHSHSSATATEEGDWFCVGTFPIGGPYTDNLSFTELQRKPPISPDEFNAPPRDIKSLGCTDNDIFFGLCGRDLMWTIPCYPMSWSNTRRICIPEKAGNPIKAIAYGEDIYVLTDKKPVYLRGVTRQDGFSFDLDIIQKILPLASAQSITQGYAGIYFASHDGYYIWNKLEIANLTASWLGKEDWCRADYKSISGVVYEDKLIWSTSVDAFMLVFGDEITNVSPGRQGAGTGFNYLMGLSLNGLMIGATAHMITCDNKMRFAKDGKVYEWDFCKDVIAAHHKNDIVIHEECCPWVYCDYMDSDRCNSLARGEIKFDLRSLKDGVNLKIFMIKCGERELLKELTVNSCEPFTIPACHNSEEYCIEMTGCEHVKDVTFACSLMELMDEPLPRGKVK